VTHELDEPSRRAVVARVAWHEYGHALSVTRATREHRERGPELLALLPAGLRETIDYPGRYRTSQVFDEVVATIYSSSWDVSAPTATFDLRIFMQTSLPPSKR
jgi:hypothetical protein